MTNFHISFEKIDGVKPDEMSNRGIKPGYEHVNMYITFYINMDKNFTRNSRLVANVHTIALPYFITY